MNKRKASPIFFPFDLSVFGDPRFKILATERGEELPTVIGRAAGAWAQAYLNRTPELSREDIQLGALLPFREPWFADQLVAVRLATKLENGLYRPAGVAKRLHAIEESYAQKVEAGIKSAEARAAKRRATTVERPLNECSTKSNTVRVTVTDLQKEEGAAASRPPSSASASEKFSCSLPTNPADTAVLDPVRTGWLTRLGFSAEAIAAWVAEYGIAKVECGLGEAYADERGDPEGFRAPPPGQFPKPEKLRLAQKLRRYIANADPPPVGAVIPLSEPKAGAVKREFCGECVNGWVSEIRFAGDAGVSRPCECTSEKLCEGGS